MSGPRERLIATLVARLGAREVEAPAGEVELTLAAADLGKALELSAPEHPHLLGLYASRPPAPEEDGLELRMVLEVEADPTLFVLTGKLEGSRPRYPSLGTRLAAAIAPEREIRELYGIEPVGLPDTRPLLVHGPPFAFPQVDGAGVHAIDLHPLSGPLGESAQMRAAVLGERVIHVETRGGFKHRGAERRGEGLRPEQAVALAERVCGPCAAAHAVALASALERMTGLELPRRAAWLRTAVLELERVLAHAAGLRRILELSGPPPLAAVLEQSRETLLAGVERLFGARLLRGLVAPGGMRREPGAEPARALGRLLRAASTRIRGALELALDTPAFEARLEEAGLLPGEVVAELDLVGPAARASGSRRDVRRDHPALAYEQIGFWVPLYGSGDALARFRVLADELQQAAGLAEETLDNLPDGELRAPLPPLPSGGRALGLVEGPRGACLHAVHAGDAGRIGRWHIHPASLTNLPAAGLTLPGSDLRDLELVRASFDLCLGCADR